jgi:hypothetical protein
MERTGTQTPVTGYPTYGVQSTSTPVGAPVGPNFLMVPRCTFKVEKCTGGFKVNCNCEDKAACNMLQQLCTMMAGGVCTCCVNYNGINVCTYNFTLGYCRCEVTDTGCCYTCTSGVLRMPQLHA